LDHLIQLLSPLALRSYSISSYAPRDRHLNIEFIFKLVELYNGCKGVATGYLSSLMDGDYFYFLKRNLQNFTLTNDFIHKLLIMIGPGSGVAPFIGFIKAKSHELVENEETILSPWWLLFGCRDSQADFLFKQELLTIANDKRLLSEFFVAFSQFVAKEDQNEYHLNVLFYFFICRHLFEDFNLLK
jgi:sulfite reductase alpha subunit-like flavoprotein